MPTRPQLTKRNLNGLLSPGKLPEMPETLRALTDPSRVARQDAYAGLGQPSVHAALGSADDNALVRRLHTELCSRLRGLVRSVRDTLRWMGCGSSPSLSRFSVALEQVLSTIGRDEDGRLGIRATDGGDPRHRMICELLQSLGASESIARQYATARLTGTTGRRTPGLGLTNLPTNAELVRTLYAQGRALDTRLDQLRRRTYESFRGRPDDVTAGVDQSLGLLSAFPDLADSIYQALGLRGVRGFVPVADDDADEDARTLTRLAEQWRGRRQSEERVRAAGLLVAGLAVSVISFGTLSPFAATLVTCGLTIATGVTEVARYQASYQQAQDGYRIGATSAATLDLRRAELSGAWQRLVIESVSLGLLARVGGSANVSRFGQFLRVRLVDASSGALGAATDPNVRRDQRAAGLIVFATVVAVVGAGVSDAAVARLGPAFRTNSRLQVAVGDEGAQVGSTVSLATGPNETPRTATVLAHDHAHNTMAMRLDDGTEVHVTVQRVGQIELGPPPTVEVVGQAWTDAHQRWGRRNPPVDARATADVRVIGPKAVHGIAYTEVELGPNAPLVRVQDAADLDLDTVERYAAALGRGWDETLSDKPVLALRNGDAFVLSNGHHRDAAVLLAQRRGSPVRLRVLVRDASAHSLVSHFEKADRIYRR